MLSLNKKAQDRNVVNNVVADLTPSICRAFIRDIDCKINPKFLVPLTFTLFLQDQQTENTSVNGIHLMRAVQERVKSNRMLLHPLCERCAIKRISFPISVMRGQGEVQFHKGRRLTRPNTGLSSLIDILPHLLRLCRSKRVLWTVLLRDRIEVRTLVLNSLPRPLKEGSEVRTFALNSLPRPLREGIEVRTFALNSLPRPLKEGIEVRTLVLNSLPRPLREGSEGWGNPKRMSLWSL